METKTPKQPGRGCRKLIALDETPEQKAANQKTLEQSPEFIGEMDRRKQLSGFWRKKADASGVALPAKNANEQVRADIKPPTPSI